MFGDLELKVDGSETHHSTAAGLGKEGEFPVKQARNVAIVRERTWGGTGLGRLSLIDCSSIAFGNQTISSQGARIMLQGLEIHGFVPPPRGRFTFIVCNRIFLQRSLLCTSSARRLPTFNDIKPCLSFLSMDHFELVLTFIWANQLPQYCLQRRINTSCLRRRSILRCRDTNEVRVSSEAGNGVIEALQKLHNGFHAA